MLTEFLQKQIKMVYTDFIWSNNEVIQRMQSQNQLLKTQLKNILDCVKLCNQNQNTKTNSVLQHNLEKDYSLFNNQTTPFSNQKSKIRKQKLSNLDQLNNIQSKSQIEEKGVQKQWNLQIQQNQQSSQVENAQNIQEKIERYDLKSLQYRPNLIQQKKQKANTMQKKRIQHQKRFWGMDKIQKKSLNRKEYRMICQFFKVLFPQIIAVDSKQQSSISKKQLLTIYIHWRLQTFTQQKEVFNISSIQIIIAKYLRVHYKDKIIQGRYKYYGVKFIAYNKVVKYFTLNIDQYKIPKYGNYNNKNWTQRYKQNQLYSSQQQKFKKEEEIQQNSQNRKERKEIRESEEHQDYEYNQLQNQ